MRRAVGLVALAFAAVACRVGPDYEPPQLDLPDQWSSDPGAGGDPRDLAAWWTQLGDPVLEELITRGVAQNLDVRASTARIDEARARWGISRAGLFPEVDATGGVTWTRISRNAPFGFGPGGGGELGGTFDQYDLGLDAGWELDVFGRVRRSIEAAGADFQASVEDLRAVRMSLAAEIALAYVELRSLQERAGIARSNVEIQRGNLDLAAARHDLGLTGELDVAQAQANLSSTEATIPLLLDGIARAFHRLALLLGETPGPVESIVGEKPVPLMPASFALGAPAELVRRRPDVRAAERRVALETALVGVATADLYPAFSLNGSFGLTSGDAGDLLEADSRRFSVGPFFRWNLLDFGRVRNRIGVQNARVDAAVAAWEQAALRALQEVEDAISGVVHGADRRDRLERAEESARRAVELATDVYRAGLQDFQRVLDAQRELLSIADQHASARATVVLEMVRLWKALGGGWSVGAGVPGSGNVADAPRED